MDKPTFPAGPDWTSAAMSARKPQMLAEFERTRAALVRMLDLVASFGTEEPEVYAQGRGLLVAQAYADVWGLRGATCMLGAHILRIPKDEASHRDDINRHSNLIRWGLDIDNTILLDTGIHSIKEVMSATHERMTPLLEADLLQYPEAKLNLTKGVLVMGEPEVKGWNRRTVSEELKRLISEAQTHDLEHGTAAASHTDASVARL